VRSNLWSEAMTGALDHSVEGDSAADNDLLRCCGAAELKEALVLTSDIHDCALEPGRWPETLRKISEFIGAVASVVTSHDGTARRGRLQFSWGDDPQHLKLYFDKYIKWDPILVPMLLLKPGDVRSVSDVMGMDRFRATRFYKEWASPAGYCDVTAAVIEKSGSAVTFLAAPHHARNGPVDDGPRRRMQLLVPHLRRAVAIGKVVETSRTETDILADAVDALSAGVFLIGGGGSVVHANAAARGMLAAGDMLQLHDGALAVRGARGGRHALTEAIADGLRLDPIASQRGVAIPLSAGNGDRYVAHILPLTSGARCSAGRAARAGASVFVHKAELGGVLPLEAIAQHFGLSRAELRVLAVVMEIGGSVTDIADVLGLSEPTVKTHLRRLFDKTGTNRQADLVRLAAGYTNPTIGERAAKS
jgi:DNA-binding CsgD family transcriptional regulator